MKFEKGRNERKRPRTARVASATRPCRTLFLDALPAPLAAGLLVGSVPTTSVGVGSAALLAYGLFYAVPTTDVGRSFAPGDD